VPVKFRFLPNGIAQVKTSHIIVFRNVRLQKSVAERCNAAGYNKHSRLLKENFTSSSSKGIQDEECYTGATGLQTIPIQP
jgi:hypothetical protein